jgi:hypothetical protein
MATVPPQLKRRADAWLGMGLLIVLVCAPGCTLDQYWIGATDGTPGPGHPCEVATAWLNRVQYAPDTVHDGVPVPGLVCRLYMFDKTEKFPVLGDGSVLITLYDDTHGPAKQPLEQWQIDPVALQKFAKKDTVGWGYTLFLPWGSCRPDVTKVHLTCRYDPKSGSPLFGPPTPLSLVFDQPPAGSEMAMPMPSASPPPPAPLPQLPMPSPIK